MSTTNEKVPAMPNEKHPATTIQSSETEKRKMLVLKSNDGEEFELEESVAIQAITIKNIVDDDCDSSVIPLPNINSKTLIKVIEYLKHHADSNASEDNLKKFDEYFIQSASDSDNPIHAIFVFIMAANYLNIRGLLDITCKYVADAIKDKPVEEVREIFSIENDYTEEEEAAIRNENLWAFE